LNDGKRQPLLLQIAFIGAEKGGKLGAGGMAHDQQSLGIAAVPGDMVMDPPNGLRNVARQGCNIDVGQQAIVGGNPGESLSR
jgi:hypothetical protein